MKRFKFLALFVMLLAVAGAVASQPESNAKLRSTYAYYRPYLGTPYCPAGYSLQSDCDAMNYGQVCTEIYSGNPMYSYQFACTNDMTQFFLRTEF